MVQTKSNPPPNPAPRTRPAHQLKIGLTKVGNRVLASRVIEQTYALTNTKPYPSRMTYVADNGVVIRSDQRPGLLRVAPDTTGHTTLIVNLRGDDTQYDKLDTTIVFNNQVERDNVFDKITAALSEFKENGFKYTNEFETPVEAVFSF